MTVESEFYLLIGNSVASLREKSQKIGNAPEHSRFFPYKRVESMINQNSERSFAMFTTLTNVVRKWTHSRANTTHPETSRPTLESLEERTCPTTVRAFANALDATITNSVNKFVHDAAVVEYYRPTLNRTAIVHDLVRINQDNQRNATFAVFSDFQRLGADLFTEAYYTIGYNLPRSDALLAYSGIVRDLTTVGKEKEITFAFLNYIASHTQYRSYSGTSSVFTSGLFAPGTIAGDEQAILAAQYQNSLTHYTGSQQSYNRYFKQLTGAITQSGKFDRLSVGVDPGDTDNGAGFPSNV
jgi:hypothetical protein